MDAQIRVEKVAKKFCKSLKQSMLYGLHDIARNMVGLRAKSADLRKNEFWAIHNASFDLMRGETLGIIGPNGSGKSTLLKLLNGIFWPDKGKISIKGRVGALIEVGAGFHPMLTGRENIYINGAILGMSKTEIKRKFDEIIDFAGIGDFLDTPVKNYSSGMFVRLGFAIAVHCEPDVLLIDEILAVGDSGFQTKCFNKIGSLRKAGTTSILVSHNMHTIATFATKAMLVHFGNCTFFNEVEKGISQYLSLFATNDFQGENIQNETEEIRFTETVLNKTEFTPGETIEITIHYTALRDFMNIEADIGIYVGEDAGLYFQATNKAFNKKLNLLKGTHCLRMAIQNVPINNAYAKIGAAIWNEDKTEKLYWWRSPVHFNGIAQTTGKNFFNVAYDSL